MAQSRFSAVFGSSALALAATLVAAAGLADATAPLELGAYRLPAPEVTRLLVAPRPPEPLVHGPSGRVALLEREPVVPLERLARPRLGLAGFRFDPETGVSGTATRVTAVEILSAREPGEALARWRPADGAGLDDVQFAPDGRTLSALVVGEPARLALFDIESGTERRLDLEIQAGWGAPCTWTGPEALLCRVIPRPAPPLPALRVEPDVIDHAGEATPLRTYSNLLDDAHEEELFEHFFTSELARVELGEGVERLPETRGLLSHVEPSPGGEFAVVTRVERPYSRMVPARRFPSVVEVWNLAKGTRLYASSPKGLGVEEAAKDDDPRRFRWRPGRPTMLGWIETTKTPAGASVERWLALEAPFDAHEAREIARSERPISWFAWTTEGTALFATRSADGERVQIWVARPKGPEVLWTGSPEDRYLDPGRALRPGGRRSPILERDGRIFLASDGLGPAGPRPFLEALDLVTLETETLLEGEPGTYEPVIGVVDPTSPSWITSRETELEAPRLFVVRDGKRSPLHPPLRPFPSLDGVERRRIRYARADGVELGATLYLPERGPDAEPLPTLIWIYPREYSERSYAEQADLRHFRFHPVQGASPISAALRGYAVLIHPTMPIIGASEAVNDAYLPQLAANAEAAVDHLVALGLTDPKRVAIGGHSYGAFSAANLVVHTGKFATGLTFSGAYNRTLTPFGFQSEKRTLWEASDFYAAVSPFFHVDQLRAPVLIVHGSADPNPGTPALQARRFFHALVGLGARARYVEMPFEEHKLRARESVLHVAAEMIDWLDRTIGPESEATD